MDDSLELLLKYPLITVVKIDDGQLIVRGEIDINYEDYEIFITQKTGIKSPKFLIEFTPQLKVFENDIQQELENNEFRTILEVLDKIKCIVEKNKSQAFVNPTVIYKKVLNEYSEFTKFFLNLNSCRLSEDLKKIYVSVLDEKHREHFVEISIDYTNVSQDIFQISQYDLPSKTDADLFKPNSSLTTLFDQFLAMIENLQPFFDVMEVFDQNCSILDPENPKRSHCYRQIWLGDNISVIVTVDPQNLNIRPDIKFLGPDRVTETYRTRLNENLENWDCENDIFQNLLDLLGIENFPPRKTVDKGTDMLVDYGECSICFSMRLNEKLPEIICRNKCCEKFYHSECLYEWLISVNAKRFFSEICGQCPNCEKSISCPIPI